VQENIEGSQGEQVIVFLTGNTTLGEIKMASRTVYCEFIIEEGENQGQRCNKPYRKSFSLGNSHAKFCDEHRHRSKAGLIRSTNVHANQHNRDLMGDWVKERMVVQSRKDDELAEVITTLTKLENIVTRKEMQDETRTAVLIDQHLVTILKDFGVLDERGELSFATQRNLITLQTQMREQKEKIKKLEDRISKISSGYYVGIKEEE
jgi:hypothetical protein